MNDVSLRGLIVERKGESGLVVTEEGVVVSCRLHAGALPGKIVTVDWRDGGFHTGDPIGLDGVSSATEWDKAATAWRAVLRGLKADALLIALGEDDFSLRFAAEWELYDRGKANLDLIRSGMMSSNWRIRASCAALMDHLADDSCGEMLLELLRDPHEKVRRAALHSVSCDQCKEEPLCVDWIPEVARLARFDRIVRVRRIATLMLGARREDPRAQIALESLLQDRDEKVRLRARWALDGVRPQGMIA